MDELERAAEQYAQARTELDTARDRLIAAIVAATKAGTRQTDIARVTGFTREYIRQLTR
jgi:hypothetical protein